MALFITVTDAAKERVRGNPSRRRVMLAHITNFVGHHEGTRIYLSSGDSLDVKEQCAEVENLITAAAA